jgi:glycosyltransferase involved in cell wall biosynthesis
LFGPYDQRRSWIKGLEYSLSGVPWVGTAGEPYSDIAHYGTLIQNSPEAWEDALETLLSNLPRAKSDAHDRIPQARQDFLIGNNLHVYEKVYGEIINNANLDRGRLPGVMHVKPA